MPSNHTNAAARLAMQGAWQLAREGQAIYGGPIRSFIAEALRIAWAELKADPVHRACVEMVAGIRAAKANPQPSPQLSPGLLAAAARWRARHGARAYGGGLGSARYTASW